jgi:predicted metalloendopeptidase
MLLFLILSIWTCEAQSDVAKTVSSLMDWTVNPCDDFWHFSCGGWIKNTTLPPTKSQLTRSFTIIGDNNQEVLKEVCQDPSTGKLNKFYSSCMDINSINAAGFKPIVNELTMIDQVTDVTSLFKALGIFYRRGVNPFFSYGATIDPGNPAQVIGGLDQGGLAVGYPEFYTAEDEGSVKIRKMYQDTMTQLFTLINDPTPAETAQTALLMETIIAGFTVPNDQLSDPFVTYNPMTLPTFMQSVAPNLDWTTFFNAINVSQLGVNVTVSVPTFFSNLSVAITASPQAWGPYLKWNVLAARAPLLSQPFRDAYFNFFSKILGGQSQPEPLWRQCIARTDGLMGELTGKYFLQKAFPGSSLESANRDLKGIIASMQTDIENIEWMDAQTKVDAQTKLSLVERMIGGPANPRNYNEVPINQYYYTNVIGLVSSTIKLRLAGIGGNSDAIRNNWDMTAATVNAYYDPTRNQMVFPAGIMQQPFFNNSFPLEMNLGGIGMVMGHELTHGFDNQGRLYDGYGRLVNWWQPQTSKLFDQKVQCVIDQYSKFQPLPGVFINGRLTQGENVADMGGINNAFKTIRTFLGDAALKSPSIVNGLSRGQLFFVAFAQTWCTIASPESIKLRVKTDPHSPAQFRVLGPLINSPQFSDTFQCPVGSGMNPPTRCQVW